MNVMISLFVLTIHCLMPATGVRIYDAAVTYAQYATLIWPLLLLIKCPLAERGKLLPVFLFWGLAFISTVINRTHLIALLKMAITSLTACLLTTHLLFLQGFKGLRKVCWLFALLMMAEYVSSLIGGLTTVIDVNDIEMINYFLGQQPTSNRIYLPALTLLSLLFLTGKRIDKWVSAAGILAGTLFMIQRGVSTGIMTLLIFVGVLIAARFFRRKQMWRNVLIVLAVFAVLFNLSAGTAGNFNWIFEKVLKKDMTLHGRTLLWASALSQMKGWHWLLGNGYGHQFLFSVGDDWQVSTAHSQYLNILFCYGLLGLGAYFFMIYFQLKSIWLAFTPRIKRVLIASGVALLFVGIPTTTYQSVYVFVLYTVLVNLRTALRGAPHLP